MRKEVYIWKKVKFDIQGMTCSSCSSRVEKALNSIEGVTKVEVNLESKTAVIESNKDIDNSKIKKAIEEAEFTIKEIK